MLARRLGRVFQVIQFGYTQKPVGWLGTRLIAAVRQFHRHRFLTPGSTCNPNFNVAQIGTNTRWSPVKNLTFTGELMYTLVDQQYSGLAALPAVSMKLAALSELNDQGSLSLAFRAQRNW